MYREQKRQLRRGNRVTHWWAPMLLLALMVAVLSTAGMSAALAETAAADEQAESKGPEDTADKSDDETQSNSEKQDDAETKDDLETAGSTTATEEAKASEESKERKKDDEQQTADSSSEESSKDEEEVKPAVEKSKEDDSGTATVETESGEEIEVEPPQKVEPKQGDQKDAIDKKPEKEKCIIGATATLLEKQTGLKFRARVDSGAKSCSLHVEKISIENESTKTDPAERMTENKGKVITFVVKNSEGKSQPIKRKIAGYVIIKNSNKAEGVRRYKVPMTFLWKNMEKEVLVTLTNRKHMDYPLLLGRNFLRGDFLVDVELNSDD